MPTNLENKNQRRRNKIIFGSSDEAMAGRAWLILMVLVKQAVCQYIGRHQIHPWFEIENFQFYHLLPEIKNHLISTGNFNKNTKNRIRNAIKTTIESRHALAHNKNVSSHGKCYKKWTKSWEELVEILLTDKIQPRSTQNKNDDIRAKKILKDACKALLDNSHQGRRDPINKAAFQFAFENTIDAKTARAFFVVTTIIHRVLKDCAGQIGLPSSVYEANDVPELLDWLYNKPTFHKMDIKRLFYGINGRCRPEDVDGDGIKESRNALAHHRYLSSLSCKTFTHYVYIWKKLLLVLQSSTQDIKMLKKAGKYVVNYE